MRVRPAQKCAATDAAFPRITAIGPIRAGSASVGSRHVLSPPECLYSLGRGSEADSALEKLQERSAKTWPSDIAGVYAWRKDPGQAAQWLDRAYAQKDVDLYQIKVVTLPAVIQDDVRYKAFLRKMQLPESMTSD